MKQLENRVCVVTGGTRGIGKAISEAFNKEGATVIALHTGSQEVSMDPIHTMVCDITNFHEVKTVIDTIHDQFGSIDVLVNNAGITKDKLTLAMKEEDFDAVIDVNLKGAFSVIKHVYPIMAKQRAGKIITISSVVGITGNKGQANYAASKAGLIGLTKTISQELAARNVNVNAIAPGFIETEMTHALKENVREAYLSRIPMDRFGKPEDIANLAVFLGSNKSDYITGQVIVCDGGFIG